MEWSDLDVSVLVFQLANTINSCLWIAVSVRYDYEVQLAALFWYNTDIIIILSRTYLFSPWYSWNIANLALSTNHSLAINQWISLSATCLTTRYLRQEFTLRLYFLFKTIECFFFGNLTCCQSDQESKFGWK